MSNEYIKARREQPQQTRQLFQTLMQNRAQSAHAFAIMRLHIQAQYRRYAQTIAQVPPIAPRHKTRRTDQVSDAATGAEYSQEKTGSFLQPGPGIFAHQWLSHLVGDNAIGFTRTIFSFLEHFVLRARRAPAHARCQAHWPRLNQISHHCVRPFAPTIWRTPPHRHPERTG